MRRLILIGLVLISFPAHAAYYQLVSCTFQYMPEYRRNVYIGTYRSQFGNLFTQTFLTYCPASINQ
jgi:hypothetical protein